MLMRTGTSPARKRMIGYIAKRVGRTDLAGPLIAEAESELRAITEGVHIRFVQSRSLSLVAGDCNAPIILTLPFRLALRTTA